MVTDEAADTAAADLRTGMRINIDGEWCLLAVIDRKPYGDDTQIRVGYYGRAGKTRYNTYPADSHFATRPAYDPQHTLTRRNQTTRR